MLEPIFYESTEVLKGWGKEVIIDNNEKYCGKLLCFNEGSRFSLHAHLIKQESYIILSGKIILHYLNLENADKLSKELNPGNCVRIPVGCPHQVEALEESIIVEVSTQHFDSDNYRIAPGDSQKSVK